MITRTKTGMKTFGMLSIPFLALLLTVGGCRNEMYDMEYGEPLERSEFFEDHRMSRPLVEGTVARGHEQADQLFYTGTTESGEFSDEFPMEVTREVMDRGADRYNIYCTPCHGDNGAGDGIIVTRGMKQPPSFLEQRLIDMPAGYFFDVITSGYGVMYSYASRVNPEDRWAIVAYLRAIQKTGPAIPTADEDGLLEETTSEASEDGDTPPSDSTE